MSSGRVSGKTVVREIGGFTLVRELGQGGMGKVFLARQKSLDRLIALKVLQPELAEDEEFLERFHREAKAAALFQHPNIVAVIDAGRDSQFGVNYIAFEFVEGGSLESLLEKEPRMAEEQAIFIMRGIAQALSFAESKGLVHRDVKPDNILLGLDGAPKLADLGLAKRPTLEKGVTQTGVVLGTPLYMAPEQALGETQLDIRADIYALGLCMWRMLTGLMPFDEDRTNSSLQILTKHINEDLIDPRERFKEISADTAQVVLWMTAREPEDRYSSAGALAKDLDRLLAGDLPLGPGQGGRGVNTTAISPNLASQVAKAAARASTSRRQKLDTAQSASINDRPTLYLAGGVLIAALGIGIGLALALSGDSSPQRETAAGDPPKTTARPVDPGPAKTKTQEPAPRKSLDLGPPDLKTRAPTKTSVVVVAKTQDPPTLVTRPPPKKTVDPPPVRFKPKTEGMSPDRVRAFRTQVRQFKHIFFRNPQQAGPLLRRILTDFPKAEAGWPDSKALKRFADVGLAAYEIRNAESEDAQRRFRRDIKHIRDEDRRDPVRTPVGETVSEWIEEVYRLGRQLELLRKYMADSSEDRGDTYYKALGKVVDNQDLVGAIAAIRPPQLRGRQGRMAVLVLFNPRASQYNKERALRYIIDTWRGSIERFQQQAPPGGRVGRAHILYASILVHIVDKVDQWPELDDTAKAWARILSGVFFEEIRLETAMKDLMRREADELKRTLEALAENEQEKSTLPALLAVRGEKDSIFLSERIRLLPSKQKSPPARSVLIGIEGSPPSRSGKIEVSVDGETLQIRRRGLKLGRVKRKLKDSDWGEDPAVQVEVQGGQLRVRLWDLRGRGEPRQFTFARPKRAEAQATRFVVRAKGQGLSDILVVPRMGPPPKKKDRPR